MRIVIDCRWLNIGIKITHRGTGRYVLQQIEAVLDVDQENTYFLIVEDINDINRLSRPILDAPNVRLVQISTFDGNQWNPREILNWQERFATEIERLRPDVYHQPAPMGRPALQFRQFDVCPYVVNLFDLIPLHYPDHYPVDDNYKRALRFIKHADQLITISEYSREDIATRLDYDPKRISVAYPYAGQQFRKLPQGVINARLQRFNLPDRFYLTVAGFHHSKNLHALIEAHGLLPDHIKYSTPLVIACHLTAWECETIERFASLKDANVIMTGYVDDDELVALYSAATAYVHPSRLEGFGLPPLEAMRCQTPVLLADASSLPEVGGDAAYYFDPEDVEDIAAVLLHVDATGDRLQAALSHAAKFHRHQLGRETLAAYEAAYKSHSRRPTIAMFSPIPPIASGIADYTIDICEALYQDYDIEFFVDDGVLPNATSDNYLVHPASAYYRREPNLDVTIHQFGNSVYHQYQYKLMPTHSNSIAVLHDLTWSFSLFKDYSEKGMYDAFGDTVARWCGVEAGQQYQECLQQLLRGNNEPMVLFLREHYMLNAVIDSTEAQIVHVDVLEDMQRRYPDANLKHIPQSIAPIDIDKHEAREGLGLPQDAFIVGSFGHVSRAKRIDVLIQAFRQLLDKHKNAVLLIAGAHNEEKYTIELQALTAGIEDRVIVTNILPDAEFKAAVATCDVVVQLRHPSQGQSSRAITQAIATGKPVIMTDLKEWDYPLEFTWRVPVGGTEQADIAKILINLARHPDKVITASQAAKTWHNENNSIEDMARRYKDVIKSVVKGAVYA